MKIIFSVLLFFSLKASAEAQGLPSKAVTDSGYQEEIQEKAKRRAYAGGQDETDLKVQVQVLSPTRKVAPVMEDTSEPVSDD